MAQALTPLVVVERLAEAMRVIKSDTMMLAAAVRHETRHTGALPADLIHWPIRWKDSEKLFEHADEAGRPLYMTLCFTHDCASFYPLAQYELYKLNRLILDTNMLSHGQLLFGLPPESLSELKTQLDAILVKSAQFVELLKIYPLVIDIIERRIVGQAKLDAIDAHIRMQLVELGKIPMLLFDPGNARKFAPRAETCAIAAFSEPYHEGQMFLHGVFFKREHAEAMKADAARRRAVMEAAEDRTRR